MNINVSDIDRIVESNRDEAIEFLTECLRTPSVTFNELEMGKVMRKWIEKSGFEPEWYEKEKDRPNLVTRWIGSKPGRQFVFNGHMDVFPPVAGNDGLYGPWAAKIVDGNIYARGSVDMKSGLCAALMAMKYLKELGYDPAGSVLFTAVSDEENSGEAGTKFLIEKGIIQGDLGVCMEPTCEKILIEHCGGFSARITYNSQSGHTSMPHPTVDAMTKSIKAINKLYELNNEIMKNYRADMGVYSLLSVTMINSGNTANMYPSESTFVIDRRLLPGEDLAEEHSRIKAALDSLQNENPDYDYSYKYECLGEYPCLVLDENEEIVRIAADSYKAVTGNTTTLYRRGGGSDASDVVEKAGIPMPNFGPGNDYEESTSENEHLPIDDYIKFIKVYMEMVIRALN